MPSLILHDKLTDDKTYRHGSWVLSSRRRSFYSARTKSRFSRPPQKVSHARCRVLLARTNNLALSAKILAQLQNSSPVPLQILAQAKAKEPPTDALPTFTGTYTSMKRVGIVAKDSTSGKLIDDWNKILSEAESKPETVDMSPAVSAILAVKDEEELVRSIFPQTHTVSKAHCPRRDALELRRT